MTDVSVEAEVAAICDVPCPGERDEEVDLDKNAGSRNF